MNQADWLHVTRREAPLVVSIPHAGTIIPADIEARLVSRWLARKDADWWLEQLYAFADGLGATVVRTGVSRTVIDVNRDPSGVSLYPGQATTGLCPVDTFDGEPLYRPSQDPDAAEIAARRDSFFDPYHASLQAELDRLVARHGKVVLYDAHSIRSRAPRLFDGELPQFNIGTNSGAACDPGLTRAVEAACDATGLSRVTNGRFKGGWITRHYGQPERGVHAVQMELACHGYIDEPAELTPDTWPTPFQVARAAPLRTALADVLKACLAFANSA
ncbi:N-formylglutamate deformylase [Caulobacter sp. Root1472]|uniref:N-formylglutamate deformylase n=1 Tax=Caulobacter sp. Root1472 TaxID=1736470 RepID=UPI0006F66C00|nr:N-formylglutamate deformylase [Caulobacter sp. Root1472]KQZ17532.1 N-formylglutamate deformylase [Caulobacter sp. Root1472]